MESQVEKLWSVPDAAQVLGVSTKTVWRLIRCGDIPAVTVSPRRTLIDPSDVRAYIEAHKTRRNDDGPVATEPFVRASADRNSGHDGS